MKQHSSCVFIFIQSVQFLLYNYSSIDLLTADWQYNLYSFLSAILQIPFYITSGHIDLVEATPLAHGTPDAHLGCLYLAVSPIPC